MIKTSALLPLHVVAYHPRAYVIDWGDVYVEDWVDIDEWLAREDNRYVVREYPGGQTTSQLPLGADNVRVFRDGVALPSNEYTINGGILTLGVLPASDEMIAIAVFDG